MSEAAAVRLKLRDPGGVERDVDVEADVIRIGRARDCEVALDSSYISRYHARLERSGRLWQVVDEGSKNGVILNGRRVSGTHALFSGDVLRLGDYTISVQFGRADDEPDYDRTVAFPFHTPSQVEPSADAVAAPDLEPAEAETDAAVAEPVAVGPPPLYADRERRLVLSGDRPLSAELRFDEFAAVACVLDGAEPTPSLAIGDAIWGAGGWDDEMLARTLHRLDRALAAAEPPRLSLVAAEGEGYLLVLA